MTISLKIQLSSWMNARVERESTKMEMYFLGLVQHGENSAWNLNKLVTSRRISCVGPMPKGKESAGISKWKEESERGHTFLSKMLLRFKVQMPSMVSFSQVLCVTSP